MSLEQFFYELAMKAQNEEYCHKKLMKSIENRFPFQENSRELTRVFNNVLCGLCMKDFSDKNRYISRGLEFLAKLTVVITLKSVEPVEAHNPDGTICQVYDISSEQFFTNVLNFILGYTLIKKHEARFNICYFIRVLLQQIGNNVEIDNNLCDRLLESLVQLLNDTKVNVRLQAIKALVKLQEVNNPECLVLKSFLPLFTDKNVEVRKSVITNIAPHQTSLTKCKERLHDVDIGVRLTAYKKFADISPNNLKIVDRRYILTRAFEEDDKRVKQILSENLLPKWLNCFKGNYVRFMKGFMLDADENDIMKYERLCTQIVELFLEKTPFVDFVKVLNISEDEKVVPLKELNLENVIFWSILIKFLRSKGDREHYLSEILPDLIIFANYIERYIKRKSSVTMDEWEFLIYQSILHNLFYVASEYDMSDEVGRKKLYSLILNTLLSYKLQQRVINVLISIASKLNHNIDSFTIDICQVISEVREQFVAEEPTEQEKKIRNLEVAQLKLKRYELEIAEEKASNNKNYELAQSIHNEFVENQKKIEEMLKADCNKEKVRVIKDDPETLCRALDILIGLLKVNKIQRITNALRTCKEEFLITLLKNDVIEVYWRVLLCLGLYSHKEKEIAYKYTKIICLPITTYKSIANHNKLSLKWSVLCATDLIRKYGFKVLGIEEDTDAVSNQSETSHASRRKLYSVNYQEVPVNADELSVDLFTSSISEMLDDEDNDIRDYSITSLTLLMNHEDFIPSTELITKLILKWFNPSNWKRENNCRVQQKIGLFIQSFAKKVESKEVIARTILPIINIMNNLPPNSRLVEVDVDNVMKFLTVLVDGKNMNGHERVHNCLAREIIESISNKPNDVCMPHLAKLLTYLNVQFNDPLIQREIIASAEMLLEDVFDKMPKRNIIKFVNKLKTGMSRIDESKDESEQIQERLSKPVDSNKENAEENTENHANNGSPKLKRPPNSTKQINNKKLRKGNGEITGNLPNSELSSNEEPTTKSSDAGKDSNESNFRASTSKIPHYTKPYVIVERIESGLLENETNTPISKRQVTTPLSIMANRLSKRMCANESPSPKIKSPIVVISKIPLRTNRTPLVKEKQTELPHERVMARNESEKSKISEEQSKPKSNVMNTRKMRNLTEKSQESETKTSDESGKNSRHILKKQSNVRNGKREALSKNKKALLKEKENKLDTDESPEKTLAILNNSMDRSRSSSARRRNGNSIAEKTITRSTRKQLNFSTDSETTLLKTFLQGDEEFDTPDSLTIEEDSTSLSNTSNDSVKENLIVNEISSSSSSSLRSKGSRKKRTRNSPCQSRSPPKRKILKNKKV